MTAPAYDTAAGVLRRALVLGALLALVVGVVASLVGLLLSGPRGLVGGLVGAGFALLFLGITAAGLLVASRFGGLGSNVFFAVLLGAWLVKFVVFLTAMNALKDQPWLDPVVVFGAVVATVLGSLVIDALVVGRARIPVDAPRR